MGRPQAMKSQYCESLEGTVYNANFLDVFLMFSCSWEPILKYINEQYDKYLIEETSIKRKPRVPDSRVHCCLYFIAPTGHR